MAGREFDDLIAAIGDIVITRGENHGPRQRFIENGSGKLLEGGGVEAIEQFVDEQQAWFLHEGASEEESRALITGERGSADL